MTAGSTAKTISITTSVMMQRAKALCQGKTNFLRGLNDFAQCIFKKLLNQHSITSVAWLLLDNFPPNINQALKSHKITRLDIKLTAEFFPSNESAKEVILAAVKTAIRILSLKDVIPSREFSIVSKNGLYWSKTNIEIRQEGLLKKPVAKIVLLVEREKSLEPKERKHETNPGLQT